MIDVALPPKPIFQKPAIIRPRAEIITPEKARGFKMVPPFDPMLGAFGTAAGHGARAAGGGGISLVGYTVVFDTTPASSGQTLTADLTALTGGSAAAAAENDLVVVFGLGYDNNRFDSTLSMSTSGYTQIANLDSGPGKSGAPDSESLSAYKVMGATPDTSITMNFGSCSNGVNSGAPGLIAMVFRGVDTSNPLDVAVQSYAGRGTYLPNPPAITPVSAGAWVVAMATGSPGSGSGYYYTDPSGNFDAFIAPVTPGFTGGDAGDYQFAGVIAAGIKENVGASTFDGSTWGGMATDSSSYGHCIAVVALRPA